MLITTRIQTVVLAGAMTCGAGAAAQDPDCASSVYIPVDEASLSIPEDLKEAAVCRGGQVVWETNGDGPLTVVFPGPRPGDPTQGPPTRVEVQVRSDATPDRYPYDIRVRGQVVDPTIIVR